MSVGGWWKHTCTGSFNSTTYYCSISCTNWHKTHFHTRIHKIIIKEAVLRSGDHTLPLRFKTQVKEKVAVFWVAREEERSLWPLPPPRTTRARVRQQPAAERRLITETQGKIIPPPRWYWGLLVTFRHKPIGSVTGMFKAGRFYQFTHTFSFLHLV